MFLIQAGHQSSTQIAEAVPDDGAAGAIWSLADETPDNLAARMEALSSHDAVQAIDPQLYVALLADANPKRLADHDLFKVPLPRRSRYSGRRLAAMVEAIIEHQADLPGTHLIAPTVAVSSMNHRSAQVALDLAETAVDVWGDYDDERPLLISVALERATLADPEGINQLLDELTASDLDGYYLMFEINPSLDSSTQAALLSEALYITYTLSVLREKPVWVGYAGLGGYLHRAVGAEAFAAGFFQKQQWWSLGHWGPPAGGRAPKPRIVLDPILGSLLIEDELQAIRSQRYDRRLGEELIAGVGPMAERMREGRDPGSDRHACAAQLFAVCEELDRRVGPDLEQNLERVLADIADAEILYQRIEDAGVALEPRSTSRQLEAWQEAIELFKERAELPS
jgi:hypothetical protein